MSDLTLLLDRIAALRADDPLAIVTVITPTRLAALQLRRRLADQGAFAGVRFETPARLAELIAGSMLARQGRRPLARPIADYVAGRIARESRHPLQRVSDIPGYARALRQTFRRLRRGGFHDGDELMKAVDGGESIAEIARLYSQFRRATALFYDDDDLLEAAAQVLRDTPGALPELGAVYAVPPLRQSAASAAFFDVIASLAPVFEEAEEPSSRPAKQQLILAPDAASEVRSVVRSILDDLEQGTSIDQIAVFTGGDRSYQPLLRQMLESALLPVAAMPGPSLLESPAGRGALALARLTQEDFSRVAVFDFLDLAPLRRSLPVEPGVALQVSQWQRVAREAGVTHGLDRWLQSLDLFTAERQAAAARNDEISEGRRAAYRRDAEAASQLRTVVQALAAALLPLQQMQPAQTFIPPFRQLIETWFEPGAAGLEQVLNEVSQLGTIDAVDGAFNLPSFVEAFEANLSMASVRQGALGKGVLVTDHRQAAGLQFERVYLCGAYEGALPAITTTEPLIQDEDWAAMRRRYPHIEDLELRTRRSKEAVQRVLASARECLTWSAPLAASTAASEFYPSSLMTDAAKEQDPAIESATALRHAATVGRPWLQRISSPLSALLQGAPVDRWELRLRQAVALRRQSGALGPGHPLNLPVKVIQSRRSSRFSEFDGNLAALTGAAAPRPGRTISPSALEAYATCGLRYFFSNVLFLRPADAPEESQTLAAAEGGSLVHRVLQRFFEEEQRRDRPAIDERWNRDDETRLMAILDEEFQRLEQQGRAGLRIYRENDRAALRADLATFLEKDSDYRLEQAVIPWQFEPKMQPVQVGDLLLSGYVDRIDRSPDGSRVVVIDYKTGRADRFKPEKGDHLKGGTLLQLPVYALAAADAAEVVPRYWFISTAGTFEAVDYPNTPEYRERFEATLKAIEQGLRSGAFPANPGDEDEYRASFKHCLYCDFDRICSSRRQYEIQQKSADDDIVAWFGVAAAARDGGDS